MPRVALSDAIAQAFFINKQDDCRCGRPSAFIHCPACGSTAFYALRERSSQATAITPKGVFISVRVFSCRACLETFSEDDCTRNCKAKPTAAFEKETAVVHKLNQGGVRTSKFEATLLEKYYQLHPERRPVVGAPEVNKVTGDVGLLERANTERITKKDSSTTSNDPETAKLFEPLKLDEGGES